jgi:ABC-type branched-subunit amino acid transport system ATPase component
MTSTGNAGTPRSPAIRTIGLTKRYGGRTVVDDVSFSVVAGRVTGFLGPNGAGKSTTMRLVLGLERPDAGKATVFGMSLVRRTPQCPNDGPHNGRINTHLRRQLCYQSESDCLRQQNHGNRNTSD